MFLRKAAGQVLPVVVYTEVSLPSARLVFLNIYFLIYKSRMKYLVLMWRKCGDKPLPLLRQNSSILLSIPAKQISVSIASPSEITAVTQVIRMKLYFSVETQLRLQILQQAFLGPCPQCHQFHPVVWADLCGSSY